MIRTHEFNSLWWGHPVGIVADDSFFDLHPGAQDEACAPYAWVEYAVPLASARSPEMIGSAGFFWVDTQVSFRIGLTQIGSTPSLGRLSVSSARETPFALSAQESKAFVHERYRFLPGAGRERLDARYTLWSNLLIEESPDWCLQIKDGELVQGWFLARPLAGKTINLTLAMLSRNARVSGLLLYQRAMLEYAARGMQVGSATFSVSNSSVLNIYASFGARFLPPRGHWLRWTIGERRADTS